MIVKKKRLFLIGAVLVGLLLAACGPATPRDDGAETPSATVESETEVDTVDTEEATGEEEPVVQATAVADLNTAPAVEIEYIETEAGSGPQPKTGDTVRVHYTGTLEDGTIFDSSAEGDPISFELGQGAVIPGWDQGIAMMHEGGKATLVIPPELAYGASGSGTIPPNSTLTFDVELVEVIPAPEPADIAEEDYEMTESGLRYFDVEPGAGDPPEAGDSVSVHFNAWLEDGTPIGSTAGGPPAPLQVGMGQVFPGLEEGISTMRVGGVRQMVIPPELAFGEQGSPTIPPNSTIIIEATLVNIIETPEASVFPEIDESEYEEMESGVKYYDVVVGDGDMPQPGQQLQVHYTGWLEDGTKFDSSIDRGQPFPFPLGVGAVVAGWDEGVATMRVGGVRILVVPPELAYGAEGAGGGLIPPDATLVFEVHLLDVQ